MIIDCYPSSFAQWDSAAGYKSRAEKMEVIHRELATHHQPAWSARDRAPVDNSSLINPDTGELTNARWTRHMGQLAWEYEGETYVKQYFPPMLHNLECPPELMIAEMDYAGIDCGILHTHPHKGRYTFQNEFQRNVVNLYPDRLMRLVMVEAHSIPANPEKAAEEVAWEVVNSKSPSGLQFMPRYYYSPPLHDQQGHRDPWDEEAMRPFWDAVTRLGVPVFFTMIGKGLAGPSPYGPALLEEYMDELRILIRWMERYPGVKVVITHGLPWRAFLDGDRIRFPEDIWSVFQSPQCHMELMLTIQMGAIWEYPWKEAEPTIEECVKRIGAHRLMWGSDWPMVGRYCTYKQALNQYKLNCNFLSDSERADILGNTAARIMGLQ